MTLLVGAAACRHRAALHAATADGTCPDSLECTHDHHCLTSSVLAYTESIPAGCPAACRATLADKIATATHAMENITAFNTTLSDKLAQIDQDIESFGAARAGLGLQKSKYYTILMGKASEYESAIARVSPSAGPRYVSGLLLHALVCTIMHLRCRDTCMHPLLMLSNSTGPMFCCRLQKQEDDRRWLVFQTITDCLVGVASLVGVFAPGQAGIKDIAEPAKKIAADFRELNKQPAKINLVMMISNTSKAATAAQWTEVSLLLLPVVWCGDHASWHRP